MLLTPWDVLEIWFELWAQCLGNNNLIHKQAVASGRLVSDGCKRFVIHVTAPITDFL